MSDPLEVEVDLGPMIYALLAAIGAGALWGWPYALLAIAAVGTATYRGMS